MKNQYYGDVNDYRKYGLIRQLTISGKLSAAVCWMLTPDDVRPDGHRIQYLFQPEEWRHYDPPVFDHLHKYVIERKTRAVGNLERSRVIPNCKFYSDVLGNDEEERARYLVKFLKFASDVDLVFFDPDNGMEVKSVPLGKRNSSKYLYFPEVQETFNAGHSLLIYQHLPPRPREQLASELAKRFEAATGACTLYLYWTQHVVFFLVPQPLHEKAFAIANRSVRRIWGHQIRIEARNVKDSRG